jgi:hypothetical protein
MNNNMTPQEALQLLSSALEPQAQGKISRAGYISIQQAIEILAEVVAPKPESSNATND